MSCKEEPSLDKLKDELREINENIVHAEKRLQVANKSLMHLQGSDKVTM